MGSSDLASLLNLSIAERIELVQDLWDSVAVDTAPQALQPHELTEIRHRLAEHLAHPQHVVAWAEVRRALGLSA
ncbi:addiction module protein [Rhodoferax sp.]|uniref:addiction module protein n=1 Tax=Rhodoferax sp. TaxID=50421 RepID=UPI00277A7380|nr:addiction module protein [Rhodoferax sp.]